MLAPATPSPRAPERSSSTHALSVPALACTAVSSETRDVPAGTAAGSPAADVVPLPLASADPDAVAGAGRLLRRLEPLHSMIYFAPEVGEELTPLGIEHPRAQYFAQRAAAMGAVGPGVVTATFYNFNPALVARSVPDVWTRADPGLVINARLRAADRALRRLLGDAVDGREIAETADLARRATEGATPEDRPLYGEAVERRHAALATFLNRLPILSA